MTIVNDGKQMKESKAGLLESTFACSADQVVAELETDATTGLDEHEATVRHQSFGPNQLAEARTTPAWKILLAQFTELMIWILIAAAVIAGLMGEWVDLVAILTIVLLNGILGFTQEEKASRALAALKAMSSPMSKVVRNGQLKSIPASELVPGDIIHLEAGDHVSADARLLDTFSMTVQEASLTGESVPVDKDASAHLPVKTPIAERTNSVFLGTTISSGKATAVVVATGMHTQLGQIAGMLTDARPNQTPLQRRLEELGKVLVIVCLVLVAIIFAIQFARGGDLLETLLVAVSLAVAAVPEGLPAVVTISLAIGLQRMVQRNALIRKLPSVETLGSVNVICSDKTGTLTRNQMTVRELCVGNRRFEITGTGYEPEGTFLLCSDGDSLNKKEPIDPASYPDVRFALTIALVCNGATAQLDETGRRWEVIGDPTEGALVVVALKSKINFDATKRHVVFELPFDSERKAMSVVAQLDDQRKFIYTKGAPEVILDDCSREIRDGEICELTQERREQIQRRNSAMASKALRVLAFAFRENPQWVDGQYQEDQLVFAGLVGMIDPPRTEAKLAVEECHRAGVRPVMITGDHPETALAIGRELKFATDSDVAVTGQQLNEMSEEQLLRQVDQIPIYARVSAAHKLRVVNAWKSRQQVVAMTGDGVNDAPAVKAADIGIAMGITGTDVTKEAADMVLTDDNFASIVSAVREGRGIFENIKKFVHYLLSCNAGEVLLMFVAAVIGMPLPLIAVQILWINLVTDGLPALALALEKPEPGIMDRPPRPAREPVITRNGGILIFYHGLLIAGACFFGFWWLYDGTRDSEPLARTATFAIASFSQLAFAMVCRSHRLTLPQLGLFSNRWLFAAFLCSGMLQISVLTLPGINDVFKVVDMPLQTWFMVIVLSLVPATFIELAKIVHAAWKRNRT